MSHPDAGYPCQRCGQLEGACPDCAPEGQRKAWEVWLKEDNPASSALMAPTS